MRYENGFVAAIVCVFLAACSAATEPDSGRTFIIEVSGERFRVRTSDDAVITQLEMRRREGVVGVVAGDLVAGDGGFNDGWSWHLDPANIRVPDAAIELCDGRPSMVEDDLTYWLETVESFCPWGAKVVGR